MFFLMRAGFWLAIVWYVLPMDHLDPMPGGQAPTVAQSLDNGTQIVASVVSEISTTCQHKPLVCETGSILFELLETQTAIASGAIQDWAVEHAKS